jgi:hypothetical protein
MFPPLPAPIKQLDHYIIFFLQLLLSFQSPSIHPVSPISPLIPSAQVRLGLPRFLLPGGPQIYHISSTYFILIFYILI